MATIENENRYSDDVNRKTDATVGFFGDRFNEVGNSFKPYLGMPEGTDRFFGDLKSDFSEGF